MALALSPEAFAVLFAAIAIGSLVQSLVGLGSSLVAAPIVVLVAPELVPVTLIVLSLAMPLVTLSHDRHQIDWYGLGWSLPAQIPGTVLGVWLVGVLSATTLGVFVGVMVLLGVFFTWRTVEVPITRTSLSVAGLFSAVAGTATSVGGPPIALLYQSRPAAQVRSTLAIYFGIGAVISLVGLGLGGQIDAHAVWVALALSPGLLLGALVAFAIRRRWDPETVRAGVLWVSAAAAGLLLVRAAWDLVAR